MLDTTIVDTQSYSDTPLSPWVAALANPKTHKRGAIALLATLGFLGSAVAPSFAVENTAWDWNSETRQEGEAPEGRAVEDLGYETGSLSQDRVEGEDTVEQSDRPTTSEQSQEPEEVMPAANAKPNQAQSEDPTKIQVVGDDWRKGGRQTEAQAALEKNPGVEKDCNGKPFTEGGEQQAELDADGNVTAAGLAEIKAHGKSYCSQNPNEPQCKPDANGDVG